MEPAEAQAWRRGALGRRSILGESLASATDNERRTAVDTQVEPDELASDLVEGMQLSETGRGVARVLGSVAHEALGWYLIRASAAEVLQLSGYAHDVLSDNTGDHAENDRRDEDASPPLDSPAAVEPCCVHHELREIAARHLVERLSGWEPTAWREARIHEFVEPQEPIEGEAFRRQLAEFAPLDPLGERQRHAALAAMLALFALDATTGRASWWFEDDGLDLLTGALHGRWKLIEAATDAANGDEGAVRTLARSAVRHYARAQEDASPTANRRIRSALRHEREWAKKAKSVSPALVNGPKGMSKSGARGFVARARRWLETTQPGWTIRRGDEAAKSGDELAQQLKREAKIDGMYQAFRVS